MTDYYTPIWSCKPCKLPCLPLGTEKTHTTSRVHLENTLKNTSTKTPAVQVWKCVLCDITLPTTCRDAHEASKRHMKRQDMMRVQLVLVDVKGEEVNGQTPPVYSMKKKKKKKKNKNRAKNSGNSGSQTPASLIPFSIPPKKLPKLRQSAHTKNGRGKRDQTIHHESQNNAEIKVARDMMNPPASGVERTVVNGAPVIKIMSAMRMLAQARVAVPKIERPPPPIERSWRTWLSERQERYGYAYSLKQEWWTCPGCKCTMYKTCKGVHELKKCKPMDLVEFLPAPKRKGAGIMSVDVSRELQKTYDSEERAAQKERYLRRAGARDKKYKYRDLAPAQIWKDPGVQMGVWSSRREMRRRKEAELMGREMEDREREAKQAQARKVRAKERRKKKRKYKARRDQEMKRREEEMKRREEEMKLQGTGGRSRGNKSRANRRRKARGHGGS